MAILPGIFTQRPTNDVNSGVTNGRELLSAVNEANKQAILNMIDNLSPGDTILGKVLSQSGKNIQILTQDGVTLNARNEGMVTMEKGSSILFEVQKHSGREISIRPLYQNTSIQNTAETALRQAGLPINNRSLEFVGRNMEYGNPIDRNALTEGFKDLALYPEASVRSIVDLQTMGIDINPTSIQQYQAYMNMESSVSQAATDIADALLNSLTTEIGSLQEEIALQQETAASAANGENVNPEALSQNPVASQNFDLSMADSLLKIADSLESSGFESGAVISAEEFNTLVSDAEDSGLLLDNLVNHASLKATEDGFSPLSVLKELMADINNPTQHVAENLSAEGEADAATAPQAPPFDALSALNDFLNKESVTNLFRKSVASQWAVNKEKLGDKAEVKDLYQRLFNQTRDMLDILSQNTDKSHVVNENITNLRNNMEFMGNLNDFTPYIQIPFHQDGTEKNSELYVYTNKKSLAGEEGEVSAFIHLDMDNLGPTDVYVKLRNEHVTTNFTVKDEATLILIEHHLDMLDRRLNEKGFSFESSVKTGKETKSPMEQMLFDTQRHLVLAETSFDARI